MKETKDQLRLVKDKLLSNQEKISDIETKVVLIVEHAWNIEEEEYSEDPAGGNYNNFNIKPSAMSSWSP